jgi:hypothetical protein
MTPEGGGAIGATGSKIDMDLATLMLRGNEYLVL